MSDIKDYDSIYGPVIVINNGNLIHNAPNFDGPRKIMEDLLMEARRTNGTLIPMTTHYPGVNKLPQYMDLQGPLKIDAANNKLLQWAKTNNLWYLDFFDYTKGLWSRDGVHYNDENIVFAQLLLNSLWRMQQDHGLLPVVSESNPEDPTNFKFGHPKDVGKNIYIGDVPRPYVSLS